MQSQGGPAKKIYTLVQLPRARTVRHAVQVRRDCACYGCHHPSGGVRDARSGLLPVLCRMPQNEEVTTVFDSIAHMRVAVIAVEWHISTRSGYLLLTGLQYASWRVYSASSKDVSRLTRLRGPRGLSDFSGQASRGERKA